MLDKSQTGRIAFHQLLVIDEGQPQQIDEITAKQKINKEERYTVYTRARSGFWSFNQYSNFKPHFIVACYCLLLLVAATVNASTYTDIDGLSVCGFV